MTKMHKDYVVLPQVFLNCKFQEYIPHRRKLARKFPFHVPLEDAPAMTMAGWTIATGVIVYGKEKDNPCFLFKIGKNWVSAFPVAYLHMLAENAHFIDTWVKLTLDWAGRNDSNSERIALYKALNKLPELGYAIRNAVMQVRKAGMVPIIRTRETLHPVSFEMQKLITDATGRTMWQR